VGWADCRLSRAPWARAPDMPSTTSSTSSPQARVPGRQPRDKHRQTNIGRRD
jgi:hypothetical protein